MKKILAILITLMLVMTTGVFADSKIPDALTQSMENYTADYSVSLVFDNNEEIVALFNELFSDEDLMIYSFDIKSIFTALFTYDSKIQFRADLSEDFQKICLSVTSDDAYKTNISPDLKVNVDVKTGLWAEIDLTNVQTPVCKITFSSPLSGKYYYIDAGEFIDEEALKIIKGILNRENVDAVNKSFVDIMSKYMQIETTATGFKVSIDNNNFTSLCDELIPFYAETIVTLSGMEKEESGFDVLEGISFKGWQILGEDGMQYTYTIKDGVITEGEILTDISIDISKIYTAITGEEWMYTSSGKIEMKLTEKVKFSKMGDTIVNFPVLTEGNSISINEIITEDTYYENEEYEEVTYPHYYVYGYCNTLPVIDGEVYVPLRMTLESAYEDSAVIDYNNGVVNVTSEYFPGFNTITMTIGTDKVYTDGTEKTIGNILLINDSTYVNSKLFSEIFGWEFGYASHNLLTGEYDYVFYTEQF